MPRRSPFVIELTTEEQPSCRLGSRSICHRIVTLCGPGSCFWRVRGVATTASPRVSACRAGSSVSGVNASIPSDYPASTSSRAAGDLPAFPPSVVVRSRGLPVNCPHVAVFPWPDGRSPNCATRRWQAAWWQRSVAQRCGAGSGRMRCARGAIAPGSSRAIRTSPARPATSSICISAAGKVQHWGRTITFSASMRRPASRPGGTNIDRYPGTRTANLC